MASAIGQTNALGGASASASPTTTSLTGDKVVGKDEFLKLLVAQISHQDPMKPMTDTDFSAQLAQFSALEQQMQTNKLLEVVATGQRGLANTGDVALVGKSVTVKGTTIARGDTDITSKIGFTLRAPAEKTTVTISDANGRAVRTITLGPKEAGLTSVLWDGKDDGGRLQPGGAYTISVTAESAAGSAVPVDQEMTGVVKSLSFESGYPVLMLDNGASAPTGNLMRVNDTTSSK